MKLYLVGFGAGSYDGMTIEAKKAIEDCDIIVGYTVYVELLKKYFDDKTFLSTPMTKEKDRVEMALKEAENKNVAIICSGDSVVYGMAGLAYEMSVEYNDVEICVVPGVTAAISGSAVLGAPLTHDFCVISLSDLLTPWEKIEKRLECAAMGDFAVAIYNPSSKKRADFLMKACDIMLKYKTGDTVCGYVKNIGRDGETFEVMTLKELRECQVDMFTTVFVGNSETKMINGKMITPRGYFRK